MITKLESAGLGLGVGLAIGGAVGASVVLGGLAVGLIGIAIFFTIVVRSARKVEP